MGIWTVFGSLAGEKAHLRFRETILKDPEVRILGVLETLSGIGLDKSGSWILDRVVATKNGQGGARSLASIVPVMDNSIFTTHPNTNAFPGAELWNTFGVCPPALPPSFMLQEGLGASSGGVAALLRWQKELHDYPPPL